MIDAKRIAEIEHELVHGSGRCGPRRRALLEERTRLKSCPDCGCSLPDDGGCEDCEDDAERGAYWPIENVEARP